MKKVLLIVLAVCITSPFLNGQEKYCIKGLIPGIPDNVKVILVDKATWPTTNIDSTITKDGKFCLSGAIPYTKHVDILLDPTPDTYDKMDEKNKVYDFFMDPGSSITIECAYDKFPGVYYENPSKRPNVKISNCKSNDLYENYIKSYSDLNAESSKLWQQYLKVYHVPALDGVFNTEEGIKIVEMRNHNALLLKEKELNFIKEHPTSPVSFVFAQKLFNRSNSINAKELDSIYNIFANNFPNYIELESLANQYNINKNFVLNAKFQEMTFKNLNGEKVVLSQLMKPGKVNMIEFWASWCGPCRGEIPHLRHIHNELKDSFNIISISVDENEKDWKKAVEEEKMNWIQVLGADAANNFGVTGVPFSVVFDENNNVIGSGLRGAELDLLLKNYLK